MSVYGCSDGGCVFGHPGGMHTNGGCRCVPSLSTMRQWTPEERLALRDKIKAQAKRVGALRVAWRACNARMEHEHRCPCWPDGALADERCECGLRALALALEAM